MKIKRERNRELESRTKPLTRINLVDSIMGSGKTTTVINIFNKNRDMRFIYVTPTLSEVTRIKDACGFCEPQSYTSRREKNITKMRDTAIKISLAESSIVTTHANFENVLLSGIDVSKYTLVLDEVIHLAEVYQLSVEDVKRFVSKGIFSLSDDNQILCNDYSYLLESLDRDLITYIKNGCLYLLNDKVVIRYINPTLISKFKNVFIMSYMLEGSYLSKVLEKSGMKINWLSIKNFKLCKWTEQLFREQIKEVAPLIDVLEDLSIYDKTPNLSFNAISKTPTAELKKIGKLYFHYLNRNLKVKADDVIHCSYGNKLDIPSFKKNQLAYNIRATNDYSHTSVALVLISKHQNPMIKRFYELLGVDEINNDKYILDVMLQFIFRTRIRKGEPIKVLVPCKKMREVLIRFLNKGAL